LAVFNDKSKWLSWSRLPTWVSKGKYFSKSCVYERCWLTGVQLVGQKIIDLTWNQELELSLANLAVNHAHIPPGQIIFGKGNQELEIDKMPGANLSPMLSEAAYFRQLCPESS
jgi:hypothetical protein